MLSVILWWLVIQLFALAALPLAWTLFARLPGRGYPLAKALGLLLVSFVVWLGASFRMLPNAVGGILAALLAVTALSVWLGRGGLSRGAGGERPLFGWLRSHWRLALATELLFLLVLAGWAAFRSYNPDISGTEKPMELAFINGVLGSTFFPPQDPWLAGYSISYYYFGYVMLGVLIRLTGVLPEVGFNLGAALWVALTLIGAFGVVYDLVRLAGSRKLETGSRELDSQARGIRYGLLGALFVGVLGNLEGVIELAYHRSLVPLSWIQWLDIKGLTDSAPSGGLTGGFWWWWHASRVIHDKDLLGNSIEVIDEFPFFSYLLGDMHPHVLGLPFVLLAIALALNLLLTARRPRPASEATDQASRLTLHLSRFWRSVGDLTGLGTPGILLSAVILGALGFLNTWDFPIYVALATLALGVGLAQQDGITWGVAGRAVAAGVVFALLGWLCYLPFYIGFQSQLGGLLPNLLFPSRLSQFFVMFGPFLVVTVAFLLLAGRSVRPGRVLRGVLVALPWPLLVPVLLLGLIVLGLAVLPQGQAYVQEVLANPAVQANIGSSTLRDLVGLIVRLRLATPWTYLALSVLIAWAAGVLWVRLRSTNTRPGGHDYADVPDGPVIASPDHPIPVDLFAVIMIGIALLLTLVPEFIYLRDLFGNRMNTVFKFYYQAWVLLALASAYGLSRLAERGTPVVLKAPVLLLAGLLVLGGLWYPAAAIPSKADNFRVDRASGDPRPTLDGLAYLRRSSPADMAAIEWLRANVAPDAVVIEATGGAYTEYARVSMATGNPTLLGWDWHERQWRGNAGYEKLAAGRPEALERIYRTARTEELPALLDQWGVDYVYVGGLERSKYKISEATLARLDSVLTRAYERDGVLIYAR